MILLLHWQILWNILIAIEIRALVLNRYRWLWLRHLLWNWYNLLLRKIVWWKCRGCKRHLLVQSLSVRYLRLPPLTITCLILHTTSFTYESRLIAVRIHNLVLILLYWRSHLLSHCLLWWPEAGSTIRIHHWLWLFKYLCNWLRLGLCNLSMILRRKLILLRRNLSLSQILIQLFRSLWIQPFLLRIDLVLLRRSICWTNIANNILWC